MSTRYRVVGHERRKQLGVYNIPDDAVWLIGDISTLEIMQQMLDRLQERSFVERGCEDYEKRKSEAWKIIRRLAFIISLMKEIAEKNLVHDYLDGDRIPRRPNRQTIADVWQLLLDGFKPSYGDSRKVEQ